MAAGKKWGKSSIAAEQARRKRNNLPPLNDAEITALLGEPAAARAGSSGPDSSGHSRRGSGRSGGRAGGHGLGGCFGGAHAASPPATWELRRSELRGRRPRVGWLRSGPKTTKSTGSAGSLFGARWRHFLVAWFIAFFRFFLPRTLFEPATSFKIGYPSDYGLGVDTKFQQKYRIWVDRTPDRLFIIYARCTHLGCTPDWKPAENKFKCPCHGSGYDSEGINFEGPAPRPMDRAHVEIAPDGQILVDVAKLYQWPKGQPSGFNDPGAYLPG